MEKRKNNKYIDPYELCIMILAIISVVLLPLLLFLPISVEAKNLLLISNGFITCIFIMDFIHNLYLAPNKRHYFFRWGWLDLIGCFPFLWVNIVRFARIMRVVRTLYAMRKRDVLASIAAQKLESTLYFIGITMFLVIDTISVLVLEIESRDPQGNIRTGQDALWWSFVTIATVGYGDFYPVTGLGRLLAIVLMIFGVGLFSLFASYLASAIFVSRRRKQDAIIQHMRNELVDLKNEIHELKTNIHEVKNLLQQKDKGQ